MKDSTKGAIFIVLFGALLIAVWFGFSSWKKSRQMTDTSDGVEVKTTVRIGGDGYLGYWFMTSPEMRRVAARRGMGVNFTDDKGSYSERLKKFAAGEYDMIVLPVSSYLRHGTDCV